MKRKLSAALASAVLLCAVLFGCSSKEEHVKDLSEPVITIGEESASLAVFYALYDNYLPYMQMYGRDPTESEAALHAFQDWILDTLADDIVTRHQARMEGFELSQEQEKELAGNTEREIEDIRESLMKKAEQEHDEDPSVSVEMCFEGLVNSESEYYTGFSLGWEDYKNYYREHSRDAYIVEAYKEFVSSQFEPTEKDVMDWYEAANKSDRNKYAQSPEAYRDDEELYETSFGKSKDAVPVTFVPKGYCRMMHIIVTPQGELSEDYAKNIARMNELESEYGRLALLDGLKGSDENAARMAELLNEYTSLKAVTDEEFAAYSGSAKAKIESAYAELESGKPFAEVMLRYTEDERVVGSEDSNGCEAFRTKGELICLDIDSLHDWSPAVKSEFKSLSRGRYSEVFIDGGSFHLIYYASDEEPGDVPAERLYEDMKAVCAEKVRETQWEALLDEWKNDPELVINMELVRSVGMNELKRK